jgi:hypothetical protein
VAVPCGSPAVSHLHGYIWVRKTAHPSVDGRPQSPLASMLPLSQAEMASSPGFLGNAFGNMPRASLETPAISVRPSQFRSSPSAAFRRDDSVGIATLGISELNQDFHPLDSVERFHQLKFGSPLSQAFSSATSRPSSVRALYGEYRTAYSGCRETGVVMTSIRTLVRLLADRSCFDCSPALMRIDTNRATKTAKYNCPVTASAEQRVCATVPVATIPRSRVLSTFQNYSSSNESRPKYRFLRR